MRKWDSCGLSAGHLWSGSCQVSSWFLPHLLPSWIQVSSLLFVLQTVYISSSTDKKTWLQLSVVTDTTNWQTERHYYSAWILSTWLCLIVSVAQWAWHCRPSCFEMAHHHLLLLHTLSLSHSHTLSIYFYLYPLSFIPCMKLHLSGQYLYKVPALMVAVIAFYWFLSQSPVLSPLLEREYWNWQEALWIQ